jgi:hypothetical protein
VRVQPKPDFSGKWKLVPEPGAAAPPAAPLMPPQPDLTISQTADTITTEEPAAGRTVSVTYKLDGTDMKQVINRADVVTKASWDGDALVTLVTGPAVNWKAVWRLANGRLTIDTTTPGRTLSATKTYEKF